MPTMLRSAPYGVYSYPQEPNEPAHVQIDRDDESAKSRLEPVALARNPAFSARALNRVQTMIEGRRDESIEAWYEYFGDQSR